MLLSLNSYLKILNGHYVRKHLQIICALLFYALVFKNLQNPTIFIKTFIYRILLNVFSIATSLLLLARIIYGNLSIKLFALSLSWSTRPSDSSIYINFFNFLDQSVYNHSCWWKTLTQYLETVVARPILQR